MGTNSSLSRIPEVSGDMERRRRRFSGVDRCQSAIGKAEGNHTEMIGKAITHFTLWDKMHEFLEIIGPKRELQHDNKSPSTLSHGINKILSKPAYTFELYPQSERLSSIPSIQIKSRKSLILDFSNSTIQYCCTGNISG